MPDLRGYTNEFMCSNCGAIITIGSYAKKCDYTYCPYCDAKTVEEVKWDGTDRKALV